MNRLKTNKAGFTLIEVIVAILLSMVVITAVYQIMMVATKSNNITNEHIESTNAIENTMENIRQMILPSTQMRICAASETAADGEEYIKCVNNVIYYNDRVIGSASQFGVDSVELRFTKGAENTILCIELNSYDENGGFLAGKSRKLEQYLHSLGGDGNGSIKLGEGGNDCIIFSTITN